MSKNWNKKVQERKYVRQTIFVSGLCLNNFLYTKQEKKNTIAMYKNIDNKHLDVLDEVKLNDITKLHILLVINNAAGKNRPTIFYLP